MAGPPKQSRDVGLDEVSPLTIVCMLFACHGGINALLLTPLNPQRCYFWNKAECTPDEGWITNWYALAHCHVFALYTAMISAAMCDRQLETTVAYTGSVIVAVYMTEGVFSIHLLHEHLALLQTVIFALFVAAVAYLSNEHEKTDIMTLLPPKLTSSSSYANRKKVTITQVAVGVQFASAFIRTTGMVFNGGNDGGRDSYLGDMSSAVYQNISSMTLCDMMLAAILLAISLRFFNSEQLKAVLWAHAIMLFVSQTMLAGGQGDMIKADEVRAGGLGTFISIVVSLLGTLR